MNLKNCIRPLTDTELKAVEFVDFVDNKITINKKRIYAVFRDGKILVDPRVETI
jgi:hypothetical protein